MEGFNVSSPYSKVLCVYRDKIVVARKSWTGDSSVIILDSHSHMLSECRSSELEPIHYDAMS